MTNVLLVGVDREFGERISSIPGHWVLTIDKGEPEKNELAVAVNKSSHEFHPDVIFVGSALSLDSALDYAKIVLETYPTIAVVLVANPDRGLIRKATRVGIRGVVSEAITDRELSDLLERAGAQVAPSLDGSTRHSHHVVVVASPKGGVGKTTTTVNLAAMLAEDAPGQVVVLDLDLQFGDVTTVVDIVPEYTVTDALASGASDSMLLRTLLTSHPAGFYVLAGATNPGDTGTVSGDQIRKLVSQFATSFRYVIIDTPAGLLEETLASLEEASDVVFVTALDVATLRAVRKEIDVLTELALLPPRRHVLLNRADRRTGMTVRDAEKILGLPVDAVLPASDKIALASNHGQLAVLRDKRKEIRKPFAQLAHKISDVIELNTSHKGKELP